MDRIPILRMGEFLLVTIQVDMHDQLAMTLQDDLTERISKTGAQGVLIDISALDMVDSFIGRMIANIAAMSRVLDAETVVVGMQPAVAITLVELGLSLTGVRTALDVESGMALLRDAVAGAGGPMAVDKDETLPIRPPMTWSGAAAGADVRDASSASRSWTRPRWSPPRASSPATPSSTAGGDVQLAVVERPPRRGLRLVFEDQGPGIPNVELALRDGYTTGKGLGLGLGGAKRLVNEFEIDSKPGRALAHRHPVDMSAPGRPSRRASGREPGGRRTRPRRRLAPSSASRRPRRAGRDRGDRGGAQRRPARARR